MTSDERQETVEELEKENIGDECEYDYYDDIQRCKTISSKNKRLRSLCYGSASERQAQCLRGVPSRDRTELYTEDR